MFELNHEKARKSPGMGAHIIILAIIAGALIGCGDGKDCDIEITHDDGGTTCIASDEY